MSAVGGAQLRVAEMPSVLDRCWRQRAIAAATSAIATAIRIRMNVIDSEVMFTAPDADETACVRRGARTGAGRVSSTASWCAGRGGKVVTSAGVVVPGDCPPVAVGTASQCWLTALADCPAQPAPGTGAAWVGAAATGKTIRHNPRPDMRIRRDRDT